MTEAEIEAIRATIESLSAKLKRFEADPVTSVLVVPAGAAVAFGRAGT